MVKPSSNEVARLGELKTKAGPIFNKHLLSCD